MKRILSVVVTLLLLSFWGCAKADVAPAPSSPAAEAPAAQPAPDSTATSSLSPSYMEAAAALAADDFDKAKTFLTTLAAESTGELKTKAQETADTKDITAMREKFKVLSELATAMQLPEGYAVAFCPMYKGGSKWVQKKETLANPYFGKTMLTCGSFVN